MNKRKLLALALGLCMVAILAVGGTLAYFTSEDSVDNVFTMGNVKIEIEEVVDEDTELAPNKKINKDVFVNNIGSKPAYVRVHIAFPAAMDDGDPEFAANKNFLHWNFTKASYADGQWSWNESAEGSNYPGNGGEWNYYETTSDGEEYAVYVATYTSALEAGAQTATESLTQVYLDATVDAVANADGSTTLTDTHGNEVTLTAEEMENITIKVWAEGTQTDTFEDAFTALNTAFGKPGTYNPWN